MAVHKDDAASAPRVDRTTLVLESKGEPITVGQILKAFKELPEDTVVSLCLGPWYHDTQMTDAVYWPKHGAIFLLGEDKEDEDDDDDGESTPAIEGDWVEVPREEDEIDPSAAEPA